MFHTYLFASNVANVVFTDSDQRQMPGYCRQNPVQAPRSRSKCVAAFRFSPITMNHRMMFTSAASVPK